MWKMHPIVKHEKNREKKHLKAVKRQLYKGLTSACLGWLTWSKIKKKYDAGNDVIILLPEINRKISHLALRYLPQLLEKKKYEHAILVSVDPLIAEVAPYFSDNVKKVCTISIKQAKAILQLYCLYEFSSRFICASLRYPYGRFDNRFIGLNGLNEEDAFVVGIYRLYPFKRKSKPLYFGEDVEIREFIDLLDGM